MVPVMPYVDVPGDNSHGYDRHNGELFRAADDADCSIRPRIMARSGDCVGHDLTRAVWRFGFTRGSEAAAAYGVSLPPDVLFVWVLAGLDGTVIERLADYPAIGLPDNFRSVMNWDPRPAKARVDVFDFAQRDDTPTVAVAYDEDGTVHDRCYTWETGQNFALAEGLVVVAVADDGHMTVADAQALYDAERERYLDCFGGDDATTGSMGERCRWNDA